MPVRSNSFPVPPSCSHLGVCGGCTAPHSDYRSHLVEKQQTVQSLFQDHLPSRLIGDIIPSPHPFYYRNKIELKFDRFFYPKPPREKIDRPTVIGFRRKGRWNATLDLNECRIFSPWLPNLLCDIRQWYRRHNLRSYHQGAREGQLKHLVLREGKRSGSKLIILITTPETTITDDFVTAACHHVNFSGIIHATQAGTGDVAIAEDWRLLQGREELTEYLIIPDANGNRQLHFTIPPFGFFQVNPLAVELLYGRIRAITRTCAPERVFDLYGGSGSIALSIADLVPRLVSVESFPQSTEYGIRNSRLNRIDNIEFICAKVERWIRDELPCSPDSNDLVILDPPRSGLHPHVIRELLKKKPPNILYVSCNPKLLARELNTFLTQYEARAFYCFDFFPFTPHFESMVFLSLRP